MRKSSLFTSSTKEELDVADILLDLPNIVSPIRVHKSRLHSFNFPKLTWNVKRKRSSLQLQPQPHLFNLQRNHDLAEEEEEQVKDNGGGVDTRTPDTPLDYVSTESDEKSNKKKRSNKMSKKQYNETIKGLRETNEVLKREVENVRKYKENLTELNSKFKDMKEKVLKNSKFKEESQQQTILGMQSTNQQAREMRTVSYPQPLIDNVMAQNGHYLMNPMQAQMYPSNGLGWANHVGRFELPDLNVSVEDAAVISQSQPMDVERDRRTRCREARRMRRGLMKVKKLRNAYGIRLPEHY